MFTSPNFITVLSRSSNIAELNCVYSAILENINFKYNKHFLSKQFVNEFLLASILHLHLIHFIEKLECIIMCTL